MNQDRRVVIYPVDDKPDAASIVEDARRLFVSPLTSKIVKTIKFNDAAHIAGVGPEIIGMTSEVVAEGTDFMLDLKLADVSKTNASILKRYAAYNIGIVTVSSCISSKSLLEVRKALPKTMIAVVCALTDIPEKEFQLRYKMTPLEKILKEVEDFQTLLGADNPIGGIVSSPICSVGIKEAFGNRYANITPGIRSAHMAKDHQEQILSAYQALCNGSRLLVIGTQLAVGNPDKGISPEQSQAITLGEINQFFDEQAAMQ